MLILTEVSNKLALGYYLWGPSTKLSWDKGPAGYISFAKNIDGGVLRFNSGEFPLEAKFSGPNVMTLTSTNPKKNGETATVKLTPLWQLIPYASASTKVPASEKAKLESEKPAGNCADGYTLENNGCVKRARRHEAPRKEAPAGSTPPRAIGGSTTEDRYRACRKLVKGFAQREACSRTGVI